MCLNVNFMFQFEIKTDYPFTFQKKIFFFFSKYPVLGYLPKPRVNTQKIFTYPLGIYPPHITTYTMLILCFLDSPDSKTCKSAKNSKSKICTITKVPLTQYYGELKKPENENLHDYRQNSPYIVRWGIKKEILEP